MVKQRPTETAWATWSRSGSGAGLAVLDTMVSRIHPSPVHVEKMRTRVAIRRQSQSFLSLAFLS